MDNRILKYIPKKKLVAIKDCWCEESLDGETERSYWIILKEGWHFSHIDTGCRTCSQDRISELKYQIKGIEKYTD